MTDKKPSRDWYRWKPRHYQIDARLLSDGADLLYRRLLDEYWIAKKLPNNARTLQQLCTYSARKWHRYWPEIESFFVQNEGYLIHVKMEEQLQQAVDKSEKAKHAANIRWAKGRCERNADAYANGMPRAREEKEKELEKEKSKKEKPIDWDAIAGLNQDAWDEWLEYRARMKFKKYKSPIIARKLAALSPDEQMACVEASIGNQYQGLFPDKFKNQNHFKQPVSDSPRAQPKEIGRPSELSKPYTAEERKNAKDMLAKAMEIIKPKYSPEKSTEDGLQQIGNFIQPNGKEH